MTAPYLTATDADFAQVTSTGKPVLVDFWATWCGPCRQISPIIDDIAATRDDITVVKVDVDQAGQTAARFRVQGVPTLVLLDAEGTPTATLTGGQPRAAIERMLENA